jgi:hypothetical protein
MCLSPESHEDFTRLAREMDDERLQAVDHHYRVELGLGCNTVEMELHSIVIRELEIRRQERIRRFRRSLWLSSRRGRFVEAIKRWLVHRGLWNSSRRRAIETSAHEEFLYPAVSVLKPLFWLLTLFSVNPSRASMDPVTKAPHL